MENEKLAEMNRKLQAENEKAQKILKEAVAKTEDAKRILTKAQALNDTFDEHVSEKVSRVRRNMESDMKGRLQTALQKQTIAFGIWTWAFCFICMIQTGYILFMNHDVTKTILLWFINRWKNCCDTVEMISGLYQWCYGYLTDYMHPYVVIAVMVLVSVVIIAGGFLLLRNVFDWISRFFNESPWKKFS